MISLSTLRELFDYNYWARDRQFEACAALTPEQFQRSLGNSFPSVRDTLAHLAGAEWVWLERWLGNSPRRFPRIEQPADLGSLTEFWRGIEHRVRNYLAHLDEQALANPLTYTNFRGETWTYPLWRTHLHVVNHQTYHRGQITMFLRQLGAEPVSVDLLVADDEGLFRSGGAAQGVPAAR
jgi:uncharacterized damage-inducible protein DinB